MSSPIPTGVNIDDDRQLLMTGVIVNSFSALGSLFIIVMYLSFKDLRSFAYKLVFLLSVSDLILGVGRLFNYKAFIQIDDSSSDNTNVSCTIQSIATTFGQLSTIIATMAISWTLNMSVVKGVNDLQRHSNIYYIVILLIPLIISFIPLPFDVYGAQGLSCWIGDDYGSSLSIMMWRLGLFYIPLWISVIFNFYNYIRITQFVKEVYFDDSESSKQSKAMITRLTYYPIIMFVCYSFATIDRVYAFFSDNEILVLSYLHVILSALQGFFNSILYGLNRQIRNRIKKSCCFQLKQSAGDASKQPHKQTVDSQSDQRSKSGSDSSIDYLPNRNFSSSSSIGSRLEDTNVYDIATIQKQPRQLSGTDNITTSYQHPQLQMQDPVKISASLQAKSTGQEEGTIQPQSTSLDHK